MSETVNFFVNKASAEQIADHLLCCDADFVPPLSDRVNITDYARKITSKATRFEGWSGGELVGLVAAYCNDQERRIGYITSVSVLRGWAGKGTASGMLELCVEHAKARGMRQISLEVASDNAPALSLYQKSGFIEGQTNASSITMNLYFNAGEEHE